MACHEFGHALGLSHRYDYLSCMTQGSAPTSPDTHDMEELAVIYEHADG